MLSGGKLGYCSACPIAIILPNPLATRQEVMLHTGSSGKMGGKLEIVFILLTTPAKCCEL